MNGLDKDALDRHITGNYGDDQFSDPAICPSCRVETESDVDDAGMTECEHCGQEFDVENESYTTCNRPGRGGCGSCDSCLDWGDAEYDRVRDEEFDR